ncbi:MAG: hypothetical protein K8S54_18900 [Spirochaetia bacterium]|nr:hypothetical protein [Spirochaetia bacterium]
MIQGILLFSGIAATTTLLFIPESLAFDLFAPARFEANIYDQKVPKKVPERTPNNPLYSEYKRRGRELNLDLDFTGVVRSMVPYDRRLNQDTLELELFCAKEKSLDVLLIGDSTMAWGVIPEVIEQRSGLRVGMFAMRSMYLNQATMRTTRRLQKYYLRDGGITLFGFAIWTQLQESEMVRRGELRKFNQYSDEEFERFAKERRSSCNVEPEPEEIPEPRLFSRGSLDSYSAELDLLRKDFRRSLGSLRESSLAREFRQWAHPAWFKAKTGDAQKEVPLEEERRDEAQPVSNKFGDYKERISLASFQFVRWDNQTLTATGPFTLRSIRSTVDPDLSFQISQTHRANAQSLLDLPGRKGFVITIYAEHRSYAIQRSIYAKLYKKHLELLDLGEMHPQERGFAMDNEGHPANLGGLEKSLLIADWLRKNFRSRM